MSYEKHQSSQDSAPPFQGSFGSPYAPPPGSPDEYISPPSPSKHYNQASTTLDANGSFQGGQYRIDHRDSNTVVRFHLRPGGEIKGKPGMLLAMDSSVQIKGKLKFSLKKLVTGSEMTESLFTGPGEVLLAPEVWGDIHPIVLDGQTKWKIGHNAFLACTIGVTRTVKGQGLTKALFSGEGLVVYHAEGQGVLFVQSVGAVIERTLQPGEQWIVDSGHLIAWSANYTIERINAGGVISGIHTGEGFVCRFTGPGAVYIQSRNPSHLRSWIRDQAGSS